MMVMMMMMMMITMDLFVLMMRDRKSFTMEWSEPNIKHKLCSNYICTGNIFIVMCKTLKVQVLTP